MNTYRGSIVLELQQRGAEYSTLLSGQWEGLRSELLGKMPVLDEATLKKKRGVTDDNDSPSNMKSIPQVQSQFQPQNQNQQQSFSSSSLSSTSTSAPKPAGNNFLLDLDDIFGGGSNNGNSSNTLIPQNLPIQPTPIQQQQQSFYSNVAPSIPQTNDLLADIFSPSPQVPIIPQTIPSNVFNPQPVPVFTPTSAPILPLVAPPANPTFKAFEKGGLVVFFELSKPNPANQSGTVILCKFSNISNSPISNLVFQVYIFVLLFLFQFLK